MNRGVNDVAGYFGEIGWAEADDDGRVARTTRSALLLMVTGAYWAGVWLLSGLVPLGHVATAPHERDGGAHR